MTGTFKVGEVCVGQNIDSRPEYNGCECIVIESESMKQGLHPFTGKRFDPKLLYTVRWSDGYLCYVEGCQLRRKQPPTGLATVLAWFTAPAPREVEAT